MSLGERIVPINIEEEMKSKYIDYSMSVIVSRERKVAHEPIIACSLFVSTDIQRII